MKKQCVSLLLPLLLSHSCYCQGLDSISNNNFDSPPRNGNNNNNLGSNRNDNSNNLGNNNNNNNGNNGNNFVSKATTDLTAQILNSLKDENAIFSPFSLVIGFGMLYEGLGGRTRSDVGAALGFPQDDNAFRSQFVQSVPVTTPDSVAAYANMVTVEDSAGVKQPFAQSMVDTFKANPFRHSFIEKPKVAEGSINKWVAKKSGDKIKDLLPPGSVTQDTRVVLVNVIYFKSNWQTPFEDTAKRPFTSSSGQRLSVDMMAGDQNIGYERRADKEIIALDFKDPDHSMVIVLPSNTSSIDNVLHELSNPRSASNLFQTISNPSSLQQHPFASVRMPKFQSEQKIQLKPLLSGGGLTGLTGLSEVFSDQADFTRMADKSQGFKVDEIYHKAVIDVNEKGVEATGATGISISTKIFTQPEVEVEMNRPFLYFIVDRTRQNVLFAGRLDNPTT